MLKLIKKLLFNNKKPSEVQLTETMLVNNEINLAREMLKEATALKKEKKYNDACDKLREAYSAKGSDNLMLKDRLRLPMYLQLAERNDEGWRELNELNTRYTGVFDQAEIVNQMRIFLQKEGRYTQAILFSIWSMCKELDRDRYNLQKSIELADDLALTDKELGFLASDDDQTVYGETPKGNPIMDPFYKMLKDKIDESISIEGVKPKISPLLKKAKKESLVEPISVDVSRYLKSTDVYDLAVLRDIVVKYMK